MSNFCQKMAKLWQKSQTFVEKWQNYGKKSPIFIKNGKIMAKKSNFHRKIAKLWQKVQFSPKNGKIMAKKSNFRRK